MISYAQNFEDVLLNRVFQGRKDGFYIDVGAHDPTELSVTKHFYDLGWKGINIEPVKQSCDRIMKARPRDINLPIAIGTAEGTREFFEVNPAWASSFDHEAVREICERYGYSYTSCEIPVRPLANICELYCEGTIDFLKIDVEGAERDVLLSSDFNRFRPIVVVVESVLPNCNPLAVPHIRDVETWEKFQGVLLHAEYLFVYFDGLNRFYLRKESAELESRFAIPIGMFDGVASQSTTIAHHQILRLYRLRENIKFLESENAKLALEIRELSQTSTNANAKNQRG